MGKMSDVLRQGGRDLGKDDLDLLPESGQPGRENAGGFNGNGGAQGRPMPQPGILSREAEAERERLVSLYAPSSPEGKRIDILRTQLLYPFQGEPPRVIMLTSAAPREGRSILTANLATSFARGLQQYVLILDCNLVNPSMHRLFGVPRVPGLADYLERDLTVPDIMHWTPVDKLSIIPAGSPSRRSAEILATDKMAALLQELKERYADRYILLDTPPVQAVDDPAVLARMVEGIVFVVMAGETDRDLAMRSLRSLPEEKIIGVVLNDRQDAINDAPSLDQVAHREASA